MRHVLSPPLDAPVGPSSLAHQQMHLVVAFEVAKILMPLGATPSRHIDQDDSIVREHLEDLAPGHLPDSLRGLDDRHRAIETHRIEDLLGKRLTFLRGCRLDGLNAFAHRLELPPRGTAGDLGREYSK